MTKIVEPPVLMSRTMTFVLATAVVVLVVLGITLIKMIPLERPEVFFLFTPTRATNVIVEPLIPEGDNKTARENYIKGFIREYIISRNTIDTNINITKNNWTKVVKPWSSQKVFSDFENTVIYKDMILGDQVPSVTCSVNFSSAAKDGAITRTSNNDTYSVNFIWICENIGGQTTQKEYRIQIRIQSELDNGASKTVDNLKKLSINPLGIQVTQYTVLGNKGDPLNSDIASWSKI